MKKKPLLVAAAVLAYALLLWLLVFCESFAPEGSIRTFGDALWYSLVTMTTVGYGDLYPVTLAGRLIGLVFLLISTGILAVVLSLVAGLLLGRMFPRLRLTLWRSRRFFIFNSVCEESMLLAEHLAAREPAAVFIFLTDDGSHPAPAIRRAVFLRGTAQELTPLCKHIGGIYIFGSDSFQNLSEANALAACGAPVYCESVIERRETQGSLSMFNRYENLARLYFRQHPLQPAEERIVLVGMGAYGQRLLEQALLVNVFGTPRRVEYHVFGESEPFRLEHPRLSDMADVNAASGTRDAVFFHTDAWNADDALLSRADRIIVCTDDDRENLEISATLRQRYPAAGRLYVRLMHPVDGVLEHAVPFGACETLFSPELVMRQTLNRLAVTMHGIYRAQSGGTAPAWEDLDWFPRQSSMAAADHLLTKIRVLLPERDVRAVTAETCAAAYAAYQALLPARAAWFRALEHERWMRFHSLHNWRWAETRDNVLRRHPLLRPFDALPPEEQRKDDFAWELLGTVGELLQND